jgi:hypothetical protein
MTPPRNAFNAPLPPAQQRFGFLVWSAYHDTCTTAREFKPDHLARLSVRQLTFTNRSAKLLLHLVRESEPLWRTPCVTDVPVLRAPEGVFNLSEQLSGVVHTLRAMQLTATQAAITIPDDALRLAYRAAVQELARTEFALLRWLLRMRIPFAEPHPPFAEPHPPFAELHPNASSQPETLHPTATKPVATPQKAPATPVPEFGELQPVTHKLRSTVVHAALPYS